MFTGSATFGYFPTWAFAHQPGLPPTDADRVRLTEPGDFHVDLRRRPARYCGGPLRLAGPMLLMLDRITGFWPGGGSAGLGRLRAEIDIDPDAWYFKAHFYEDPVQPGSLGNEAFCQLLRFYLIETGGTALPQPGFVLLDTPVTWKYRGQVVPTDERVTVEMDILDDTTDDHGRVARAEAWLWVDGRRIYHMEQLGIRITTDPTPDTTTAEVEHTLDPVVETWLGDHRPVWTVPALPMMCTADLLVRAASDYLGREVTALHDLQLRQWCVLTQPTRLRTRVTRTDGTLTASLFAHTTERLVPIATAVIDPDPPGRPPDPFEPLTDLAAEPLPYDSADMFHGPAFHYLTEWWLGPTGASGVIDPERGTVPPGCLQPGILDAMTHVIPHQRLWQWSPRVEPGRAAFPSRLRDLRVFGPLPRTGRFTVEARFAGFDGHDAIFPVFDLQLRQDGRVLAAMRLVETLTPLGPLSRLTPPEQRAFFGHHEYVNGFGLSTTTSGHTTLDPADVTYLDLLPGATATAYGPGTDSTSPDRLERIAIADHVARIEKVHPAHVTVADDLRSAHVTNRPDEPHAVEVTDHHGHITVHDTPPR